MKIWIWIDIIKFIDKYQYNEQYFTIIMHKVSSNMQIRNKRHELMEKQSPLFKTPQKLSIHTDRSHHRTFNKQKQTNSLYTLASDVKIIPNIAHNVFGFQAIDQIFKCLKILEENGFLKLQSQINGIYFLMKTVEKKVKDYYSSQNKISEQPQNRIDLYNIPLLKESESNKSVKQKICQISCINFKIGEFHLNELNYSDRKAKDQKQQRRNPQKSFKQNVQMKQLKRQKPKGDKNRNITKCNSNFRRDIYLSIKEQDSNQIEQSF